MEATAKGSQEFSTSKDFQDFLEIGRRVTIPYYEESRLYFKEHYLEYSGESKVNYSHINPDELKNFLTWIDEVGLSQFE